MIGLFIYLSIGAAAVCLIVGAKKKKRWGSTLGLVFFAIALATLAEEHTRRESYWFGAMYAAAAIVQLYAAIRTWRRWPGRNP